MGVMAVIFQPLITWIHDGLQLTDYFYFGFTFTGELTVGFHASLSGFSG